MIAYVNASWWQCSQIRGPNGTSRMSAKQRTCAEVGGNELEGGNVLMTTNKIVLLSWRQMALLMTDSAGSDGYCWQPGYCWQRRYCWQQWMKLGRQRVLSMSTTTRIVCVCVCVCVLTSGRRGLWVLQITSAVNNMSSPLASLPTSSTTQNCPQGFDALADRSKEIALVYLLLLLNPLNLNTLKCSLSFVHCAADDQINDGSYQSSMLTKKSSRSTKFTCCQIICVPFF